MASKCQTCEYFRYHCGVAPSLARKLNIVAPERATCYCDYAGKSWERKSAEAKKPRLIPCKYTPKDMQCQDCGKPLKKHSDAWLVLTREAYICMNCGAKKKEAGTDG